MLPTFLYIHGFASSPNSVKVDFLYANFKKLGFSFRAPDMNVPDFSNITVTSMIERIKEEVLLCPDGPIYIIASSLGAMAALCFLENNKELLASRVKKMIFLAPSFHFVENRKEQIGDDEMLLWKNTGGKRIYHYHYKKYFRVRYQLIEDAMRYDVEQIQTDIPILIFHGKQDDVIDYSQSKKYAEHHSNVTLRLLKSDHQLHNALHTIWSGVVDFFSIHTLYQTEPNVILHNYNLAYKQDMMQFKPLIPRFLEILQKAYKNRCYDRDVHLKRIYQEKHSVFLAFKGTMDPQHLVGVSYIRPDGKRSATAVDPDYQNLGIGRSLIFYSVNFFADQFTEVESSNQVMAQLLLSCGFCPVISENVIAERLKDFVKPLVFQKYSENRLVYLRDSSTIRNICHEFMMFEKLKI